jgi:hypothetical protein
VLGVGRTCRPTLQHSAENFSFPISVRITENLNSNAPLLVDYSGGKVWAIFAVLK